MAKTAKNIPQTYAQCQSAAQKVKLYELTVSCCRTRNISIATLAGSIGMERQALYQALRAKRVPISLLIILTNKLHFDFVSQYRLLITSELPAAGNELLLQKENQTLKQEIAVLQSELEIIRKWKIAG